VAADDGIGSRPVVVKKRHRASEALRDAVGALIDAEELADELDAAADQLDPLTFPLGHFPPAATAERQADDVERDQLSFRDHDLIIGQSEYPAARGAKRQVAAG
jgi:hypothetical protein